MIYQWYAFAADLGGCVQCAVARDNAAKKLQPAELIEEQEGIAMSFRSGWFYGRYHIGENRDKCVGWWQSTARLGSTVGPQALGRIFRDGWDGHGQFQDPPKAYVWLAVWAEEEPDRYTETSLKDIGSRLTKEQLAEAQYQTGQFFGSELKNPRPDLAAKWFKLAAENGYTGSPSNQVLSK